MPRAKDEASQPTAQILEAATEAIKNKNAKQAIELLEKYLGDPAFQNVPVGRLLDPKYLDARAKLIGERSMRTALPGDTEAAGTSHISIVDAVEYAGSSAR